LVLGHVDRDGKPIVLLDIGGRAWPSLIDTGFNGALELPEALRPLVKPRFQGTVYSILAGGQSLLEESYLVDFPFDGETVTAEAVFAPGTSEILLGTLLLDRHRLEIDFVARTVRIERVN
jgi:predicted aspartyl protease